MVDGDRPAAGASGTSGTDRARATGADLHAALTALRPTLLQLARLQLRNDAWAEDVVSETVIAALEGASGFAAQSQLKTWVIGILKHKIIDQFRRVRREVAASAADDRGDDEHIDELFDASGHRREVPTDWGDPEATLISTQFLQTLQTCLDRLPAHLARIFMMREWLELDTAQICKELGISTTNCFVLLYRARMRLRECLQVQWFGRAA